MKILVEFDKIFRKNKISYNLARNTLIGTVRHRSFIPWDDVAIALLRPEYEKFKAVCKTDLGEFFFLADTRNEFAISLQRTDFVPPVSLEEGLRKTLEYEFLSKHGGEK